MSDILDKAMSHFRDRLSEDMEYVSVPEWGDKDNPLLIYYKPMTLKQQDAIFKHVRAGSLKSLVETLLQRSLDEDGKRLFKTVHMTEFMRKVDPDVIERIVTEMGGGDIDPEEAEKN